MNWSRRFDDPIKTPDGKTLRTLKDAAEYVTNRVGACRNPSPPSALTGRRGMPPTRKLILDCSDPNGRF
jgi:hypothetical protein